MQIVDTQKIFHWLCKQVFLNGRGLRNVNFEPVLHLSASFGRDLFLLNRRHFSFL